MMRFFSPRGARTLLVSTVLLLAGCADDGCDPQSSIPCSWLEDDDRCIRTPSSCNRKPPTFNVLQLDFSTPLPVRVEVFRGRNHETGTSVWGGTPHAARTALSEAAGEYSATALYVRGGDTIVVVDGITLEPAQLNTCDETCYGAGTALLDLRLAP